MIQRGSVMTSSLLPRLSLVAGRRARQGSIGGAADDGGVEYRRAVAGYAVACGLSGASLPGMDIAPEDAIVESVALETDDPIDDIRIRFTGGMRAFIQAKRHVDAGRPFKEAVKQWVAAAREGLDPSQDRIVIAGGSLSGTIRHLGVVLERARTSQPGALTKVEAAALAALTDQLTDLTQSQRDNLLACAVIWQIAVENPDEAGSQVAMSQLRHVVADGSAGAARLAWLALVSAAGRVARLRGGHELNGWLNEVRRAGVTVSAAGTSPAATIERGERALERYRRRAVRAGERLDLRPFGASFAALEFDMADSEVLVGLDPNDDREESELLWAFLRRRRVLLTGLPGGGKSTSLRRLAGQLASDPTLPLPVLISLRDERTLATSVTNLRDRILALAVAPAIDADRPLLREEIQSRLAGAGPIALLLDGLDETYEHRAAVVGEIEDLAEELPDGVSMLLATRDVAYAQAASLGWADLRLRPPKRSKSTISAVLSAAAAVRFPAKEDRRSWIKDRARWVNGVIRNDKTLGEVPLFPTLLALLASERSSEDLPTQRAFVLQEVIRDVVANREAKRIEGIPLGSLEGTAKTDALTLAFWVEGAAIVESGGSATSEHVRSAISSALAAHWGLSTGHANAAAVDAARLFDESGVFVFTGASETVVPRIALFAEIGDATLIAKDSGSARAWVQERIETAQLEALVLACTLNGAVAKEAEMALALPIATVELAQALMRADREVPFLSSDSRVRIANLLIERAGDGTRAGWGVWHELLGMPLPKRLRPKALRAASKLGSDYGVLARASMLLRFPPTSWAETELDVLREVLSLNTLALLPDGHPQPATWSLRKRLSDGGLAAVQLDAAAVLLDWDGAAIELVMDRAHEARTRGAQKGFIDLLLDRGYREQANELARRVASLFADLEIPDSWLNVEESDYRNILAALAEAPFAVLTPRQSTDVGDLADFVETLDMNYVSVTHFYKMDAEQLRATLAVLQDVYQVDRRVISSEAALVLERLDKWGGHAPFYALFDEANAIRETSWHTVEDVDAAADLLLKLFWLGADQARVAARALWGAPLSSAREQNLRDLIEQLKVSPRHERYAALALASLATSTEPAEWVTGDDPILRRVAVSFVDPTDSRFDALLADPDGHVRDTAIKRLAKSARADVHSLLRDISSRPNPGWTCLSCRTENSANDPRCRKGGCFSAAPDPARTAKLALTNRDAADSGD